MAVQNLDFQCVCNNNKGLVINVLDADGEPFNATAYAPLSIIWKWFLPGQTITKSTLAGTISITSNNPLTIAIPIRAVDTLGAPEGYYPHEAITVDINNNPVTITNDDAVISWGTGFLRRQLTVQS